MSFFKLWTFLIILPLSWKLSYSLIIVTWDFPIATQAAWETLLRRGNAIDIIESGCGVCELGKCSDSVGFGGHPDEDGETTLDAMIMDGVTMDVGGIAGLRRVKSAISVARRVLENTEHSLIAGDLGTEFAMKMGFLNESLQTKASRNAWQQWKNENCQPNFWKNVDPDPSTHCGPYRAIKPAENVPKVENAGADNHDTIGMVAIDWEGKIAAGTSTNGLKHKIPGRVGDSPIAGSGAYADQEVGAAAATGDGDIMMRFSPSFLAVELMRQGHSPTAAAEKAIARIAKHYPNFTGALIALNKDYEHGAACYGLKSFPYYTASAKDGGPVFHRISCA